MAIKSDIISFGSALKRYESYKCVSRRFLDFNLYVLCMPVIFDYSLFSYYCFLLQKPIGVIALLDEAWYCLSSLTLIGVYLLISTENLALFLNLFFLQHVSKINT